MPRFSIRYGDSRFWKSKKIPIIVTPFPQIVHLHPNFIQKIITDTEGL